MKPIIAALSLACLASAAPVKLFEESPVSVTEPSPGIVLVDFGKVSFGNIEITPPKGAEGGFKVHFGEAFQDGRINRKPPGTVRYSFAEGKWTGGKPQVVAPPADARNTQQGDGRTPPAILTPKEWGVVTPFRWVEIEGWPADTKPEGSFFVRRSAFSSDWENDASHFQSSDETLNRIWELCKYSIKATTFAGVYVDGDRERIPYEADAYLNQLSHYATDDDILFARDSFDYLIKYGTWPTEWAPHLVFMVKADWMRTGDKEWLAPRYEKLKKRILMERVGPDGLVTSNAAQIKKGDIVDWPHTERDGFVFTSTNSVVNAFHWKAVADMATLAAALGKTDEESAYRERYASTGAVFQKTFFNESTGLYRDGIGTDHSSIHSNFFPLAFGLVPFEKRPGVLAFLKKSGMKCSVYAAQYLMEAMFDNGSDREALALMTAGGDRSWKHMVNSGTTITWEAWDQKYKPNQDWNHAWGAAPANLISTYVLGARPATPGWQVAAISPRTGDLAFAKGKVPTPRGPILIDWKNETGFALSLELPERMTAMVDLPAAKGSTGVFVNGEKAVAKADGGRWLIMDTVSGKVRIEVK
jgi:hypothetical protein